MVEAQAALRCGSVSWLICFFLASADETLGVEPMAIRRGFNSSGILAHQIDRSRPFSNVAWRP